jgi:hypothetical protein
MHSAGILEEAVFGPDGRIVETRRDRVGEFDLSVGIGEEPGLGSLKDPEFASLKAGGVFAASFRKA